MRVDIPEATAKRIHQIEQEIRRLRELLVATVTTAQEVLALPPGAQIHGDGNGSYWFEVHNEGEHSDDAAD